MPLRRYPPRVAFTLIELLIVIAIIAILALIAVPNFLEAQTRAKVARAEADMRTYATVMESYMADHGTYIHSICPDDSLANSRSTWKWFSRLTTPIAYMTAITFDPFSKVVPNSWGGGQGPNPFHLYTGNGVQWSNTQAYIDAPRIFFLIMSIGPNGQYNMVIDTTDSDAFVLYDYEQRTNVGGSSCYGMPYDPSNGTVSNGDIYRFSGKKLMTFRGAAYDAYSW